MYSNNITNVPYSKVLASSSCVYYYGSNSSEIQSVYFQFHPDKALLGENIPL